jgi:predicted RNase H-like HicB family nuclease
MTSYAVVIERASDGGHGAWSPDLPGCVAVADTEDAALAGMRQAIELHLPGSAKTASQSHILQPWRQPSSLSTQPDPHARSEGPPPLCQRAGCPDQDGMPGWPVATVIGLATPHCLASTTDQRHRPASTRRGQSSHREGQRSGRTGPVGCDAAAARAVVPGSEHGQAVDAGRIGARRA